MVIFKGKTLQDVARERVLLGAYIESDLLKYIDLDALARDLKDEGYTETEDGVIFVDPRNR